jgi:hypothetical protein
LLEATSSTAEGEHKQESSKEDPSTPRPKRLMLALVSLAIFIKTIAAMVAVQLSSQGPKSIPLFYRLGVIVTIVDVILVGVIFLVLAAYFRLVVKDQRFLGKRCMMMAGILRFSIGLSLGVLMRMILPAANWGLQGGLTAPNLVSILLASLLELTTFLAFTAAYVQAVSIIWNPEEAKDGGDDGENSSSYFGTFQKSTRRVARNGLVS